MSGNAVGGISFRGLPIHLLEELNMHDLGKSVKRRPGGVPQSSRPPRHWYVLRRCCTSGACVVCTFEWSKRTPCPPVEVIHAQCATELDALALAGKYVTHGARVEYRGPRT